MQIANIHPQLFQESKRPPISLFSDSLRKFFLALFKRHSSLYANLRNLFEPLDSEHLAKFRSGKVICVLDVESGRSVDNRIVDIFGVVCARDCENTVILSLVDGFCSGLSTKVMR